ncbi:hypothetical protein [Halobacillus seohaensis]|uniref:Zinc ribbon domain-containing protein n=1 Tax=Halobacillus seohaensis TaxID=447421 RepID=A0ABW2ES85_9BACI
MGEKNSMERLGEGMQQAGNNMMGCGCLLTLLITIPIIIIIFL